MLPSNTFTILTLTDLVTSTLGNLSNFYLTPDMRVTITTMITVFFAFVGVRICSVTFSRPFSVYISYLWTGTNSPVTDRGRTKSKISGFVGNGDVVGRSPFISSVFEIAFGFSVAGLDYRRCFTFARQSSVVIIFGVFPAHTARAQGLAESSNSDQQRLSHSPGRRSLRTLRGVRARVVPPRAH